MWKLLIAAGSALMMISALVAAPQGQGPRSAPRDEPKAKGKKKAAEGAEDLRKAYDLLRRLRSDEGPAGRPGDRLKDWTSRAAVFYRRGLEASRRGDAQLTHEFGAAAHDLARAAGHARNAERLDRPDPELPPPDAVIGAERVAREERELIFRTYDRLRELSAREMSPEGKFYLGAARDLYNGARRDVIDGRIEPGAELARASDAMAHVAEHLMHAADAGDPERPVAPPREPAAEAKKKKGEARKKADRSEPSPPPKAERPAPERDGEFPPALPE